MTLKGKPTTSKGRRGQNTSQYATHQDLIDFREKVADDLNGFRHEFQQFAREVNNALAGVGRTNWSVVFAGVTVAVVLAGMAGALINSQIFGESVQRNMADEYLVKLSEAQHFPLAKDIAENRTSIKEMDGVLQREMRMLDEVLQREMGLHVDRLEALIQTNADNLSAVSSNRFTVEDGNKLSSRIDELRDRINRNHGDLQ